MHMNYTSSFAYYNLYKFICEIKHYLHLAAISDILLFGDSVPKSGVWSSGFLRDGVIILARSMGALDNDTKVSSWKTT